MLQTGTIGFEQAKSNSLDVRNFCRENFVLFYFIFLMKRCKVIEK